MPVLYRIIRSRRRTTALIISPDATLTVRAPMRATLEYIEKLVAKKKSWIDKKQRQIFKSGGPVKSKEFISGEEFLYLGKIHKLHFENFDKLDRNTRRAKVMEWYKQQALEHITARANLLSAQTSWKFTSLSITKAESRWGSCGPRGSINFSWRLMMATLDVIDYVVVHELAHTIERNHSSRFWDKVRTVVPDYKERRKWLRQNGGKFKI